MTERYTYNIKIKAFDSRAAEAAAGVVVSHAMARGLTVSGPLPLPTKREIITVLRSTHINKTSREQFALFTHKRVIRIGFEGIRDDLIKEFELLSLPAGSSLSISPAGERLRPKKLIRGHQLGQTSQRLVTQEEVN